MLIFCMLLSYMFSVNALCLNILCVNITCADIFSLILCVLKFCIIKRSILRKYNIDRVSKEKATLYVTASIMLKKTVNDCMKIEYILKFIAKWIQLANVIMITRHGYIDLSNHQDAN